jgi:hypothetical protein
MYYVDEGRRTVRALVGPVVLRVCAACAFEARVTCVTVTRDFVLSRRLCSVFFLQHSNDGDDNDDRMLEFGKNVNSHCKSGLK